ncbi:MULTISPECIES: LysM peptidoglycan-binding domain-containing protein [unclassified Polaribacter]|jgi:LysM repeat protein|uniref:LysM peptidoglycan-binding domain-containing protein n=1 Tax=unclassified Polaribacter TaxID=196858 RepID=UPI00052E3631|nr:MULTISPECIES: LysM peptidoglycan-binding domain-containing protein [unclassified Polaribacter]KGL61314.1 carbohydrate binding protein, CBM50 domain protein [Polaribacter sp. Hel1_33_49]PKV64413.1 LysM domain-containing protein [Polaribacter sp. Hel1_33_96]
MKEKYQNVLDLGQELEIKNGNVKEVDGILHVAGTAKNQYEKNLIWDKIKEIGGDNPTDIIADISVEDTTIFANHTVKSGDTLGKIAKHYYGNAMKYTAIYDANTNILKNPDVIHPGQELVIPNL